MNNNLLNRALKVKHIIDMYYEPHTHAKSIIHIYRRYVYPQIPISKPTLRRYMKIATEIEPFIGNGRNRIELKTNKINKYVKQGNLGKSN